MVSLLTAIAETDSVTKPIRNPPAPTTTQIPGMGRGTPRRAAMIPPASTIVPVATVLAPHWKRRYAGLIRMVFKSGRIGGIGSGSLHEGSRRQPFDMGSLS